MDDTYRNSLLELSGYKLERRDRNTGGGGVISYIRLYIQARRRKELESNWLDHQIWKIKNSVKILPILVTNVWLNTTIKWWQVIWITPYCVQSPILVTNVWLNMTIQGRNYHWGRRGNCLVWFSENGKWNKGKKHWERASRERERDGMRRTESQLRLVLIISLFILSLC